MFKGVSYTKPGGNGVPALHPAENPGYGSEIFEPAAFGAACRTGTDSRRVELIHRRGLLEVFEDIGIFSNVAAVNAIRLLRHFLDGFFPRRSIRVIRFPGTRESLEAGRDHELQIPFGQHWIGILPVEDLALLGNAD